MGGLIHRNEDWRQQIQGPETWFGDSEAVREILADGGSEDRVKRRLRSHLDRRRGWAELFFRAVVTANSELDELSRRMTVTARVLLEAREIRRIPIMEAIAGYGQGSRSTQSGRCGMKLFGGRVIGKPHSAVVFLGNQRIYKFVFWGRPRRRLEIELTGNQRASEDPFWTDLVVPVRRIPFGLMAPRCTALPADDNRIQAAIEERLQWLEAKPVKAADDLIDGSMLDQLCPDADAASRLRAFLSSFHMPLSSAHGDFHLAHLHSHQGRLAVIDWELYRATSSFLFDATHYIVRDLSLKHRQSWVTIVFDSALASRELAAIAERFGLTPFQLLSAYAVNRAALEGQQFIGRNGRLTRSLEPKYRSVHEAIDQRL